MKHLNQTLSTNAKANAEDVLATKIFLRFQGLYHTPEWGISQFPDRALFDAIKAYQKHQGLKVDGVMKPEGETETSIKAEAQKLQSMGRNGDTILAHITPAEAQLLHDVTDGGSINPDTGLPEFFFGDFFSGLSTSFSSIGTSLSDSFSSFDDSFTSGLSEIGDSLSNSFSDTFGDNAPKLGEGLDTSLDTNLSAGLSDALETTKLPQNSTFGGIMDNLKPADQLDVSQISTPDLKPTPSLNMGQSPLTQSRKNLGIKKHGLGFGQTPKPQASQMQEKAPLTFNQKIEATAAKMKPQKPQNLLERKVSANSGLKPLGKAKPDTAISDQKISATMENLKAENPDLNQSYNQWKSEATTRIKAQDAGLKSQSHPGLPPRKPETPPDKLFQDYRKNLAPREGGYADRPAHADLGGATKQGMSQKELNRLRATDDWKHLPQNSKDLTDAQINNIYRKEYFDRAQIAKLSSVPGLKKAAPKLSEQVFDSGVQHGIQDGGKWLQESLDKTLGTDLRVPDKNGKLIYDGIIGSDTREVVAQAVREGKIKGVNNLYADKRISYMRTLPELKHNPGWVPRAKSFKTP